MKHVSITMLNGFCHQAPCGDDDPPFEAFKKAVKGLGIDFWDVASYIIVTLPKRRRVEVQVTVNMVVEMPEDLDVEDVVMDGSFDEFTVYISDRIKRSLWVPRELSNDEITAEDISIEAVRVIDEQAIP